MSFNLKVDPYRNVFANLSTAERCLSDFAIVAALVTGMVAGFINGLFIVRVGVPPLIMTLATLGLCIGVNTAIYSVLDAVLLRPIPYPNAERLGLMVTAARGKNGAEYINESQNGANTNYFATARPVTVNQTGLRSFCSFEDAVVRVQPTGAAIGSYAACGALSPLNQYAFVH